jgi:aldose 1-epimerase
MQNGYEWLVFFSAAIGAVMLLGCAAVRSRGEPEIMRQPFGRLPDGTAVHLFTLKNANGVEVSICNYGGIVVSFKAPDRNGKFGDIVLGFDNLEDYLKQHPFFGCIVGRYGNRIAKGKFSLDGKDYHLATNNGPNALHGGLKGFDKVIWDASVKASALGPAIELRYLSKDGEEGYPGNLSVTAVYTLTVDNALQLDYTATTDKATIVNLTQHSYFNLAGHGGVLNYDVMIAADKFTPVDNTLIPTGELRPVEGTPFDFRKPTRIGARIDEDNEQLKFGGGYDHNFVFNKPLGKLELAARVHDPSTGRVLEVLTTEPAMQFYTANQLGGIKGKAGQVYGRRGAFCMEPQHFPDSPNHPNFPSTVLKPGEVYRNTIIYRAAVAK